jgi:M6 family metalloprotease-like protein
VRPYVVLIAGLASLSVVPFRAVAQSQLHPRWEIPGFDFRKDGAWRVKARRVADVRQQLRTQGQGGMDQLNAPLRAGAQTAAAAAVTGTQSVPAVLFSYKGTPAQFKRSPSQYASVLFSTSPPGGNPYTLRTFYDQMSNGLFTMTGTILGWVQLDSAEVTYTGTPGTCSGNPFGSTNCNGLFSSDAIRRMQNGFRQALSRVDGTINFGQFDNDGPDGLPNSADDDGFVDMILFAHATKDGACGPAGAANNHIWSHRYVLVNATQTNFQDYVTNDARFGGGSIRISDYFASSGLGGATSCDSTQIMPIGTAAHEFGHALGLPDLYDTQGPTEGIGRWGLMGSGNLSSPMSPARMEAWSLDQLGWIALRELTIDGTYGLGPVATADTSFLIRPGGANPRGEYFLLENRQAALADTALIRNACQVWYQLENPPACQGGLLIWHVDQTQVNNGGPSNQINVGSIHGVELEEADGARDLWCPGAVPLACNRGDAGDPYPGITANTAFTLSSTPAAVRNSDGQPAGFAIDQITQVTPGGPMSLRLAFPVWVVRATPDTSAFIQFDGTAYQVFRGILSPSSTHTVAVDSAQLTAGGRTEHVFLSWSDGQPRSHSYTAGASPETLTVTLARSHRLDYGATAGGSAAADTGGGGTAVASGSFFADGTPVTLTATAGSRPFTSWAGDTASTNATITLPMGRPFDVRAVFLAPLTTANVVSQLLSGTGLAGQDTLDLDGLGNSNGQFDVGDFLAWVKTTGAPLPTEAKGGRP